MVAKEPRLQATVQMERMNCKHELETARNLSFDRLQCSIQNTDADATCARICCNIALIRGWGFWGVAVGTVMRTPTVDFQHRETRACGLKMPVFTQSYSTK
jgi:hypothetical protein